ncbi:uncharacterized protein RSE6_10999 [Rhynchosporium secalis]|uniref:Uncharacterized protein n=1 Tax=Rhynchosporium secalis TaxID=38038 RepID=A0A1E1MMW0_RHYSE|nr:uncharacterized protein RSE6_10999 [Rhynchosporium secalis]
MFSLSHASERKIGEEEEKRQIDEEMPDLEELYRTKLYHVYQDRRTNEGYDTASNLFVVDYMDVGWLWKLAQRCLLGELQNEVMQEPQIGFKHARKNKELVEFATFACQNTRDTPLKRLVIYLLACCWDAESHSPITDILPYEIVARVSETLKRHVGSGKQKAEIKGTDFLVKLDWRMRFQHWD